MSVVNIKKFPDDLHHEAKVAAAKKKQSLQDWFIDAVREKLKRESKS